MNNYLSYLLFSIALILAVWVYFYWLRTSREWLPDILKSARLVMVEKDLRIKSPWLISGRPDRVYRLSSGQHVPMEYKTRDNNRVYKTDIAQLSLQAWLLRCKGYSTASYGFIAIRNRITKSIDLIPVRLEDNAYCENLIAHYFDLILHRVPPKKSIGPKCNSCGHKSIC